MADFSTLPPELMDLGDAAGIAAFDVMQGGGSFDECMTAAMDVMTDGGMPPEVMMNMADTAQGAYNDFMAENPGASAAEAFDAVTEVMDTHLDECPDGPCTDFGGDMPPVPDMGAGADAPPPPPPVDLPGAPGDMAGGPDGPPPGMDMDGDGMPPPPPGDMPPPPDDDPNAGDQ